LSVVAGGHPLSIKKRFLFSVGANIARAALSLLTGLLVARGLGPADYGNLAYLLGSFWAIRALLDMGTASAFYTFIAQRHRDRLYYLVYFGWLAMQFVVSAGLVALLLPSFIVDRFWLGQARELILLAMLATFLQNQIWQTVVQMHEAVRQTIQIQVAGFLIVVVHLFLIVLMLQGGWLSIGAVLWAIVAEYLLAAVWLSGRLRKTAIAGAAELSPTDTSLRATLADYLHYCRPMAVIAVFAFCHEMADRWLLQRFGGASQQGFYQVASQLSTISLLASTSILNILWKEVAEACEHGDHSRVLVLYQKTTRLLVLLAAVVSCFLAPWSEQLVGILLGNAYHAAWPVLFVMLFYPIFQAMGQINGTLFMATGQTRVYMKITVAGLLVSIPVSYLLIVPAQGVWLSGLGLGAIGLAIKIVGLNALFVNIQSWVISRHYGSAFQWKYQVSGILALITWAYTVWFAAQGFLLIFSAAANGIAKTSVLFAMACSGLIYLYGVFVLFKRAPAIIGLDENEVTALLEKMKRVMRRGKGYMNGQ
jgi:O-antigen/teichoic acid export membrane protein